MKIQNPPPTPSGWTTVWQEFDKPIIYEIFWNTWFKKKSIVHWKNVYAVGASIPPTPQEIEKVVSKREAIDERQLCPRKMVTSLAYANFTGFVIYALYKLSISKDEQI